MKVLIADADRTVRDQAGAALTEFGYRRVVDGTAEENLPPRTRTALEVAREQGRNQVVVAS